MIRIIKNMSSWDWMMILFLTLVAVVTLHFYFISSMDYWKKRGFPHSPPSTLSAALNLMKMLAGQSEGNDAVERLYREAGDQPLFGFYEGTTPCLLIKDPDLLRTILVKDFYAFMDRGFELDEESDPFNAKGLSNLKGHKWKNMRARLSPTFTSGRMKAMFPLMQACSEDLLKSILKIVETNSGEATIEIKLMLFAPKLLKILGLKFTMDESYVFFRNFVQEVMKKREEAIDKGEGSGYGDFIHQLVLLKKRGIKKEEINSDDEEEENEFLKSDETDVSWANVDLDDLAAQAMLFFSAGFETTSSLLSFAMFELSSSENGKQIQRRVAEEVEKIVNEEGGMITYDGLKRMHLLDRVLNETLRLHPPAGVISRLTIEDYQIPGSSLKIDKNIPIFIPISAVQRDGKFFSRPDQFDPDRFLQKDQWNHFTYIPFGEGPRFCIGQRFAMMQARLALAALISKFEFDICSEKTPLPLKYNKKAFILTPQSGVWLKTKVRQKKE